MSDVRYTPLSPDGIVSSARIAEGPRGEQAAEPIFYPRAASVQALFSGALSLSPVSLGRLRCGHKNTPETLHGIVGGLL